MHYKNKPYRYIDTVKHSETLEDLVLYETLYENNTAKLWVRPKEMFFEKIKLSNIDVPRFEEIPLKIKAYTTVHTDIIKELSPLYELIFKASFLDYFESRHKHCSHFYLVTGYFKDEIAGFKLGYSLNDRTFYSWMGAVHPKFQGLGVGTQLMKHQHEWCKNNGFHNIETSTKNKWKQMLILNLKNGFDIVGSDVDERDETKILLKKKL